MIEKTVQNIENHPFFEYKGAIHIHSRHSDGSGSLKQIVRAGIKTHLDYLIVTDHNHLKLKKLDKEGWYDRKLLVMVGEEVSHSNQHLLALGIHDEIEEDLPPDESSMAVQRDGGLGIVAHPDGQYRFLWKRDYRWINWDLESIAGIEIWSYMFDWIKRVKPWNLPYYFLHPDKGISGPQDLTLSRWDKLNRHRLVFGVGSIDAHARGVWPIKIFPYHQLFKTVVTYVQSAKELSTDNHNASQALINQIRAGRCYFSYEKHSQARGFRYWLESPNRILEMGDRYPFEPDTRLNIILPKRGSFRIVRNGNQIYKGAGKSWNMSLKEPGVYRIEADYNGKPWIFSNPIVLTDGEDAN